MDDNDNGTSGHHLPRGTRALFGQIIAALDLPPGDRRIEGAAATVVGVLRSALNEGSATDHDLYVLSGIVRDSITLTAPVPRGGLPHRVPQDSTTTHRLSGRGEAR